MICLTGFSAHTEKERSRRTGKAVNIWIDWDRLHEYRADLLCSIPSDFVPQNLYETMEYYLINSSEDGWSDDEKEKFLKTAIEIGNVLEKMFGIHNAIPQCISKED